MSDQTGLRNYILDKCVRETDTESIVAAYFSDSAAEKAPLLLDARLKSYEEMFKICGMLELYLEQYPDDGSMREIYEKLKCSSDAFVQKLKKYLHIAMPNGT